MSAVDDTIVAIATPPGRGGLGVVRMSGSRAARIARALLNPEAPLAPRHATLRELRREASAAGVADQVMATFFPAPHSFTGEDVVEISAHGSPVVLHTIVQGALSEGARLARGGEFTLRAFVNGKIDLVQAEAIGDLVSAVTPTQARLAYEQLDGQLTARVAALHDTLFDLMVALEASLDFPEEGYHFVDRAQTRTRLFGLRGDLDALLERAHLGRTIREGATVAILGRPNAGKSSLFNALVGHERAIVSDVAGTTRDLITERIEVGGVVVTLVDTAGDRESDEIVEHAGVVRGRRSGAAANLVLVVLDRASALTSDDRRVLRDTESRPRIVVGTKADLAPHATFEQAVDVVVSARTGEGLGELRRAMCAAVTGESEARDLPTVANLRHIELLRDARRHVDGALDALEGFGVPEEVLLSHLQDARGCFDDLVGKRSSDDVLAQIFETFCIGK